MLSIKLEIRKLSFTTDLVPVGFCEINGKLFCLPLEEERLDECDYDFRHGYCSRIWKEEEQEFAKHLFLLKFKEIYDIEFVDSIH